MFLCEATEAVIGRAVEYRIPGKRKKLWTIITSQIAKQDSYDGHLSTVLEQIIRDFLKELDEKTTFQLYRDTEIGMADQAKDEERYVDDIRFDVEMALLQAVTDAAWDEARPKQKRRKYDLRRDDPDYAPDDPW